MGRRASELVSAARVSATAAPASRSEATGGWRSAVTGGLDLKTCGLAAAPRRAGGCGQHLSSEAG